MDRPVADGASVFQHDTGKREKMHMDELHLSSRERAILLGEIDWQASWLQEHRPSYAETAFLALRRLERALFKAEPIDCADLRRSMMNIYRVEERNWLLAKIATHLGTSATAIS